MPPPWPCRQHRGDIPQAQALASWLETVVDAFARRILSIEHDTAQVWGRLRVPHAEHALDKWIAATALIHDLTIVTRNAADFAGAGVRLLIPFD